MRREKEGEQQGGYQTPTGIKIDQKICQKQKMDCGMFPLMFSVHQCVSV